MNATTNSLRLVYRACGLIGLMALLSACDGRTTDLKPGPLASDTDYQIIDVSPSVVAALRIPPARDSDNNTDEIAPPPAYQIGEGDELDVRIWLPNLDTKAGASQWTDNPPLVVRTDGYITLPVVGDVPIAGKTLVEARAVMNEAMAQFYKNWQLRVEMVRYTSQEVNVLGAVKTPRTITLTAKPLSVLRAIAKANGVLDTADIASAELQRADGSVQQIDLRDAHKSASHIAANTWLQDGDRLTLKTTHANRAFVLGEVQKPQLVTLRQGTVSVMEMLTSADGLSPKSGSYAHVYVVRGAIAADKAAAAQDDHQLAGVIAQTTPAPMSTRVYQLNLTDATGLALAAQFPVQPMDIVYVSPTAISRWSDFINGILPISSTLLLSGALN